MSNYCETKSAPITAIELAALRKADTVSFHRNGADSLICASKKCEASPLDPFAPREREVRIPVDFDFINSHGEDMIPTGSEFVAFEWVPSAQYDMAWQTIAHFIKAGDVLCLHWYRGAMNSPMLISHGLVGDMLSISIRRGEGKNQKTFVFLIDKSVSENNTARMIKARTVTYALT